MKKGRISQQQIARDLGISQTLVSLALNGRSEEMSEESYQQIWSHARRVGYRPRGMDANLSPSKGATVGFLLRSGAKLYNQSPFFGHVQHGLHTALERHGIGLVFLGMEDHLRVPRLRELYGERGALRGLVVFGEVKRSFLHALKQLEPRIVVISAQYPGLCHSVVYNEEQAAALLVNHLAELGHREFAWLGAPLRWQRVRSRFEAAMSALRLRGFTVQPRFIAENEDGDRLGGQRAAQDLLRAAGRFSLPTAWIAHNGTMARGAVSTLLQHGLRIPGDISIAAFDNTRLCEEECPTLTAAGAEPERLGAAAAELLLKSTGQPQETFSDIVLASEFVLHESTGKPRVQRKRKT